MPLITNGWMYSRPKEQYSCLQNHNEHIEHSPLINDQDIKCLLKSQARWSKWTRRQEGRISECLWAQQRQEWDTAAHLWEMEMPKQTLSFPELMRPCEVPSQLYQSQWSFARITLGLELHLVTDATKFIPHCGETCRHHTNLFRVVSLKKNKNNNKKNTCNFCFYPYRCCQFTLLYSRYSSQILYLVPRILIR